MSIHFKDTDLSLVGALQQMIVSLQAREGDTLTVRDLMELVGEQGLLLFCAFLTLPFLLPVSIPGVSTVFGLVIILIGIGVTRNSLPWLPRQLIERPITRMDLIAAFEKGEKLFNRLEHWVKPRFERMTSGTVVNFVNGLAVTFGGILLIFPLGLIPFSNTLPAFAIMFLVMGMLQRDGYFIVAGYLFLVATVIYFGVLALTAILGGQMIFG